MEISLRGRFPRFSLFLFLLTFLLFPLSRQAYSQADDPYYYPEDYQEPATTQTDPYADDSWYYAPPPDQTTQTTTDPYYYPPPPDQTTQTTTDPYYYPPPPDQTTQTTTDPYYYPPPPDQTTQTTTDPYYYPPPPDQTTQTDTETSQEGTTQSATPELEGTTQTEAQAEPALQEIQQDVDQQTATTTPEEAAASQVLEPPSEETAVQAEPSTDPGTTNYISPEEAAASQVLEPPSEETVPKEEFVQDAEINLEPIDPEGFATILNTGACEKIISCCTTDINAGNNCVVSETALDDCINYSMRHEGGGQPNILLGDPQMKEDKSWMDVNEAITQGILIANPEALESCMTEINAFNCEEVHEKFFPGAPDNYDVKWNYVENFTGCESFNELAQLAPKPVITFGRDLVTAACDQVTKCCDTSPDCPRTAADLDTCIEEFSQIAGGGKPNLILGVPFDDPKSFNDIDAAVAAGASVNQVEVDDCIDLINAQTCDDVIDQFVFGADNFTGKWPYVENVMNCNNWTGMITP